MPPPMRVPTPAPHPCTERRRVPIPAPSEPARPGATEDTLDLRLPEELLALLGRWRRQSERRRVTRGRWPGRRPATCRRAPPLVPTATTCSTASPTGARPPPPPAPSTRPRTPRTRPAAHQPLDERPRRRRLLGAGRPRGRHRGPPARPARRRRTQRPLPRRAGRHADELLGDLPRGSRPAGPPLPGPPARHRYPPPHRRCRRPRAAASARRCSEPSPTSCSTIARCAHASSQNPTFATSPPSPPS